MKVFDYHLNPKIKKDLDFKSFYFKPEKKEQEKLGSLFIVGELENFLSKDKKFLNQLAEKIKKEFYNNCDKEPKEALNESLKETNDYLKSITKQDSQYWLGNLHLAIINVKDYKIHFTKSGEIRMLLLRGQEYIDIGVNLELEINDNKKYFSNLASGNLAPEDKIIIITEHLAGFFETYLASHFLNLGIFTQKEINKLIKEKKEEMRDFCGILFLIITKKDSLKKHILKYFLPNIKIRKKLFLIIAFVFILLLCYFIYK
jgi:hypothetical protein